MRVAACLYVVQTLTLLLVALREAPRPARGMTWLWVCTLLPGVGLLLYLWLSRPLAAHRPLPLDDADGGDATAVPEEFPECARRLATPLTRLAGTPIEPARVRVLGDGDAVFAAMLEAVQAANTSIDAEFYIYRSDAIGRRIGAALADGARRGVRVRVLLDGWGSRSLSSDLLEAWKRAGVEVRFVFPLPPLGRLRHLAALNYRDHCKILLVDRRVGYTGGINVGLEYTGHKPGTGHWRDTQIELTGPAAARLAEIFEMNWSIAAPIGDRHAGGGHPHGNPRPRAPHRTSAQAPWTAPAARPEWVAESAEEWMPVTPLHERPAGPSQAAATEQDAQPMVSPATDAWVQIVESGPDEGQLRFRDIYFTLVTLAEHSVDITTPYFAPGADILTALCTAARRGVHVRLLLPKVPDHRLIAWAERTYYRDLLEAGVQVHLYEGGILHAKVMTVDGRVGIVGAANYDWRSFRLDFEIGAVVYDPAVVRSLTDQFEHDLRRSTPISLEQLTRIPWWQRALDRGARLLAPFL